jgi:hypothetical protein
VDNGVSFFSAVPFWGIFKTPRIQSFAYIPKALDPDVLIADRLEGLREGDVAMLEDRRFCSDFESVIFLPLHGPPTRTDALSG